MIFGQDYRPNRVLILVSAIVAVAIPASIVLGVIFAFLPVLSWWLGVLLGIVVAVGVVYYISLNPEARVLSTLSAHKVVTSRERLLSLTESLSLTAGVVEPDCYVVDDPARNALAVSGSKGSAIICTSGLLDALSLVELEGVVAELLVRIKSGDSADATLASALFGIPILDRGLPNPFRFFALWASQNLLGVDRELIADRMAVGLTRYPPGLRQALLKMQEGRVTPDSVSEGTDYLWIVPPSATYITSEKKNSRASLSLRIDVLSDEI